MTDTLHAEPLNVAAATSPLVTSAASDTTATEGFSPEAEQVPKARTASTISNSKEMGAKRLAIVVPNDDAQALAMSAAANTKSADCAIGRQELSASLPELHKAYSSTMALMERPWSGPDAPPRGEAQSRADTEATLRGTGGYSSPANSMRRRRSSSTAGRSHSNERPESALILVEATSESVRESNWFRSQPLSPTHQTMEIERLKRELEETKRQQRIEYELRTIAETKCARMECELAELSSNIQMEAQNLVAMERRGHKREMDRLMRTLAEVQQLCDVDGEQVLCLKQCLEAAASDLDAARAEAARLRTAVAAFERSEEEGLPMRKSASQLAPPHIAGRIFFGTDGTRADTRVAEFLGFLNVASEREAMGGAFVQRCVREDVEPTLGVSSGGTSASASGMPSLSAWQRHRRLLHSVMDNTLVLEAFTPRTGSATRVLSLACHLCGSSTATSSSIDSSSSSATSNSRCELYRLRFGDNEDSKPLCAHCHSRMVAVCSFFSYLRIVRKGLIKRPIADIWLEVNKARLQMWLARSGASPESRLSISDCP